MRPLLALLLLACTPAPDCETACGMVLVGSDDCAGLQAAERRVLDAFAPLYPLPSAHAPLYRAHDACRAWDGLTVEMVPQGRMRVWGLTEGHHSTITDQGIAYRGLAHMLAHEAGGHVLDRALAGMDDLEHATWAERGIWAAIDRAAGGTN